MKTRKHTKQSLFRERHWQIIIVVLLVAVTGTLLQIGSFASSPTAFSHFSVSDRAKFNKAAQAYWSTHSTALGVDSSGFKLCPLSKVKLHYYHYVSNQPSEQRIARAVQGGGTETALFNNHPSCEIDFNKASLPGAKKMSICATFVHEYGHLIGAVHVNNPSNVMYYQETPMSDVDSGCGRYFLVQQHY